MSKYENETREQRDYDTYGTTWNRGGKSSLSSGNIYFDSGISTRINDFTTTNPSNGTHVALAGGSNRATGKVREHHGAIYLFGFRKILWRKERKDERDGEKIPADVTSQTDEQNEQ